MIRIFVILLNNDVVSRKTQTLNRVDNIMLVQYVVRTSTIHHIAMIAEKGENNGQT
jgi:hypothetical protein